MTGSLYPAAPIKTLRVLMVTPRYLPEMGGVENHVYQVSTRLAQLGLQVTILTTDREGKLPRREVKSGVGIQRVRAWPTKQDYFWAPEIYPFILKNQFDLVHIQSYHTLVAPLAMLAAKRANMPYLLTFHGGGNSSSLRNAVRGLQLSLLRPLLARAERLITLAHFEQTYYAEKLRLTDDHFTLIPNGADLPRVVDTPQQEPAGTVIASVGRLERYKGHQRIIAALPFILKEKPEVQLWVAGKGPYESALRRQAKELSVEDHIRFEAIPPEERVRMAQELSRASLVVLLSEYETHPIAILEALSLGRPALVANTSGLSELCERGLARGISIDSTPEQVAQAVLEQFRNPLIPAKISLPTWDDCTKGLLDLYNALSAR